MVALPIIAAALTTAEMATNIVQGVRGLSEAEKAVEEAKRVARDMTDAMIVRNQIRAEESSLLMGAQRAAVAQAGLSSSSGATSARNRTLVNLFREVEADERVTQQQIRQTMAEARAGKAEARQRLASIVVGGAARTTGSVLTAQQQIVRGRDATAETDIEIPTKLAT